MDFHYYRQGAAPTHRQRPCNGNQSCRQSAISSRDRSAAGSALGQGYQIPPVSSATSPACRHVWGFAKIDASCVRALRSICLLPRANTSRLWGLGRVVVIGLPAPPPFSSMNSTPRLSKARVPTSRVSRSAAELCQLLAHRLGAAGPGPGRVEKSTLAVPSPRRYRDKAHLHMSPDELPPLWPQAVPTLRDWAGADGATSGGRLIQLTLSNHGRCSCPA